ncbi:PfkB domain protein [Thermodesulfobium narugense DSM 14796]|uniref:PfkB domain protein n=1 Tax=Thermodesulfobium narugense DSM 14796 TaxID=747365 RepID=M1E5N6_9BACT|nr:PfkB family carbohydrate kinase [Thermodesulfobium narugense]AEE14376.1 PfkB domain protein [Thermodesulfobium narugense DSM 14796]
MIFCVGTIVFDTILVVKKLALVNDAVVADEYKRTFGGAAANCAVAIKKLSVDSGLISVVGDNDFHHGYESYLKDLMIDTKFVFKVQNGYSPRSILITRVPDGAQQIYFYEDKINYEKILESNISSILDNLDKCKVLHFTTGYYDFYKKFLIKLKELKDRKKNIKISFDPGQQTLTQPEKVIEILPYVDFLFMNEFENKKLCETLNVDNIMKYKKFELSCVSLGKNGCEIFYNGVNYKIPAIPPKKFVDSTGAGDSHRGAFLASYLLGFEFIDCAYIAASVSSFVLEKDGAQTNLPTLDMAIERAKKFTNSRFKVSRQS